MRAQRQTAAIESVIVTKIMGEAVPGMKVSPQGANANAALGEWGRSVMDQADLPSLFNTAKTASSAAT
jgi:hypothetical protein